MTREEAKELSEMFKTHGDVIKAYGEGRTIQHLNLDGEWVDCDMPISFSNNHSFRIKPEEVKPIFTNKIEDYTPFEEKHYRPFKDCDELIKCYRKRANIPSIGDKWFRPEIWIKSKMFGTENLITALDNDKESIGGSCVFIQDIWIDMQELFDNFTFLDNSPCGCLEYKGDNAMEEKDYDVTKDKGRITVRNVIDTLEVRKKLNPDAEKLDKENGIEE